MSFGFDLIDEVAAFMQARIMLSAADLDLFTELERKPRTSSELAADLDLDTHATTRVLDCLVVTGVLAKTSGCYCLTDRGAPLSSLHPTSILPMIQHMSNMWDNWSQLTETVRQGTNPALTPVIGEKDKDVMNAFIGAMHVIGQGLSRQIAEELDLSAFSLLLDIGGGSDTYTMAFLEENPHMKAVVFDFPGVLELARERIKGTPFADRVSFAHGNFYHDELPAGCDCALLSAIIHQNSPQENIELFRKISSALVPGGCILIRDHIMDESRTSPPAGAFFAINMLVATPAGDTYTFAEVKDMLELSGFTDVQLVKTGSRMDCIVQARKQT
jgi:SAM-dependent methyltransferase